MAKLAIKGHATRGKEVIEILEMLGGNNKHDYCAYTDGLCFYIGKGTNIIYYDWVNSCYEDEDTFVFTLEEFLEKFPYKVGDKVIIKAKNQEAIIDKMVWCCNNITYWLKYDGIIEGNWRVEHLQPYKEETMENKLEQITLDIPNGYEFFGINDDNQVVLAKKQPQYPKTYKECCDALGLNTMDNDAQGYKGDLIIRFQELLIARDAYWKIAGETMGLGKPWRPDWGSANSKKSILYTCENKIHTGISLINNHILAFSTEEMRNAFYKNFKELIEGCKELL